MISCDVASSNAKCRSFECHVQMKYRCVCRVKHFGLVNETAELLMPLSWGLKPKRSSMYVHKPDPLQLVTTRVNYVAALEWLCINKIMHSHHVYLKHIFRINGKDMRVSARGITKEWCSCHSEGSWLLFKWQLWFTVTMLKRLTPSFLKYIHICIWEEFKWSYPAAGREYLSRYYRLSN